MFRLAHLPFLLLAGSSVLLPPRHSASWVFSLCFPLSCPLQTLLASPIKPSSVFNTGVPRSLYFLLCHMQVYVPVTHFFIILVKLLFTELKFTKSKSSLPPPLIIVFFEFSVLFNVLGHRFWIDRYFVPFVCHPLNFTFPAFH